jgi:hypothetical protein
MAESMTPESVHSLDLTVAIGTYGSDGWVKLAEDRAIPSVIAFDLPYIHVHLPDGTLAEARNQALDQVTTRWVAALDADDELEGGFAVYAAKAAAARPDATVLVPQVRYIHPDGAPGTAHWPRVYNHTHHDCVGNCLPSGNWIVVGAPVRTELAQRIRWQEWERYEDWAFWLRCYQAGAVFARAEGAIYRAHVRADSRNQRGRPGIEIHRAIAAAHGAPAP